MTMFITVEQISVSLPFLAELNPFFGMSFLAFKKAEIPVGKARGLVFSQIAQQILERHYKPASNYSGFYNPFVTSDQSKRWTAERYGSTSLQRITTDTFGDTFVHKKKESSWGWRIDYVKRLQRHLGNLRIPAFHLAVWLYRDAEWSDQLSERDVIGRLFREYLLSDEEIDVLFDTRPVKADPGWISQKPVSEGELLTLLGSPPGWAPPAGAALRSLEVREVGPAHLITYKPAERLNIITGNNSLGKTFLLECIWWALTGGWLEYAALPRRDVAKTQPRISFSLTATSGRAQNSTASYNWDRQCWTVKPESQRLPGLVIYSRFDGSFAIWDPARSQLAEGRLPGRIFLTRRQVWDGSQEEASDNRERWVCNGILRDWLTWQTSERYKQHYAAFISSLAELSPSPSEQLVPGEPYREPLESRAIPTLRMPYGDVPITYVSAGVQRIVALAYALVWTWQEHLVSSSIIRRDPQRHLVLIVDEVEAHLHPLWQRLVVPALMRVTSELSVAIKPQLHIATHSPLVLASVETVFEEDKDDLHHLRLEGGNAVIEEIPFVKRGRADLWLVSDVFGLGQARSLPAERAIEDAKALQMATDANDASVRDVHARLTRLLAPDDDFWPRWRYFADRHGVKR